MIPRQRSVSHGWLTFHKKKDGLKVFTVENNGCQSVKGDNHSHRAVEKKLGMELA
ncbi:MAG: hypothetical protein IKP58_01185 [Victivallales bacterium]|nr:hypothetical protein [Victivallales bacterium]